jgi:hypothetical protein
MPELVSDEYIEALVRMINVFAPFPDDQKRRLLRSFLANLPQEEVTEVLHGVEVAKMKAELRKLQRSPAQYARKLP